MTTLKTIAQTAALAGLALTAYGFFADEFGLAQTCVLTVFFFCAHIYAHAEIEI
jgi:hypothetical protein